MQEQNQREITRNISNILNNESVYESMSSAKNPYGDGDSAKQIYSIIEEHYNENNLKIAVQIR